LTVCVNGYGKRTPFGPNLSGELEDLPDEADVDNEESDDEPADETALAAGLAPPEFGAELADDTADAADSPDGDADSGEVTSGRSYRTQRRGGKGLRDIKTTARNGPVMGIVRVCDLDEVMMISARGKIQRISAADISVIGRNTQGVRVMSLDEADTLVAVKRVPREEEEG
jgi:DNA gyrase subunit A